MAKRIREPMRELFPEARGPLGDEGKTAEVVETFLGGKEKKTSTRANTTPRTLVEWARKSCSA